jgi:hypothetical protein
MPKQQTPHQKLYPDLNPRVQDLHQRGLELVMAEQMSCLYKHLSDLEMILKDRPFEFGLTRYAEFFDDILSEAQTIHDNGAAYIAAERIKGRN